MTQLTHVSTMPRTALRDSSHTASITPIDTTNRLAISPLDGTLPSMHTASSATSTGIDARITWFIESSITVSDALLHAIWKPFITAMMVRPFQSFCNTLECRELYSSRRNISGESAQDPNIMWQAVMM